jgi:crossover junction endodeoxyribonuclease RuvC
MMIVQLLKLSEAPAEDAADALAVALCHAQTSRSLTAMAGATGYARGRHK